MEKYKTVQPNIGTWGRLPSEPIELVPKIKFDVNIPVEVIFLVNEPKEYQSDTGVYYLFDVEVKKEKRVIITSAWSLLKELKLINNLMGKRVIITKVMDKGKQFFKVKLVNLI